MNNEEKERRMRALMNKIRQGQAKYNQAVRNFREIDHIIQNLRAVMSRTGIFVRNLHAAESALARSRARDDPEHVQTRYRIQMNKARALYEQQVNLERELRNRLRPLRHRISRVFGPIVPHGPTSEFWNTDAMHSPRLKHMQGTRLASALERLYLRPGGLFSKKIINNTRTNVNSLKKQQNAIVTIQRAMKAHVYRPGSSFVGKKRTYSVWNNPNSRPNRKNYNSNEAFNKAMNNWRRRGAPGGSKN